VGASNRVRGFNLSKMLHPCFAELTFSTRLGDKQLSATLLVPYVL